MSTDFSVTKFLRWTTVGVMLMFVVYAGIIIAATWPISELSIAKVGTFGDSFGPLTSLFTGLGFAGLLATVFLQREELKLNRSELKETRSEIQLQNQTFHRQRFEDAFYQMLKLYKDNLRELSTRPHEGDSHRVSGIDALKFLNTKFEKAWDKHLFHKFPEEEGERSEYLYVLVSTIKSVFVRQTRYVETLSSILVLIEDECTPSDRKETYWRILASQLTSYEIKYLFYQALIAPEFTPLRNMMFQSTVLQDRLATLDIPDPHRRSFEAIWNIKLPKMRNQFTSPLSSAQIKMARKLIQKRRNEELAHGHDTKDGVESSINVSP
ncbi:MAG: putative phage abortive infection protein [Gallionella sp.]|nr:putative phage abortive infection protein [Gallionella sp.]MDD4958468.1 putative phage abortive infection protein [Gallionella sp.]